MPPGSLHISGYHHLTWAWATHSCVGPPLLFSVISNKGAAITPGDLLLTLLYTSLRLWVIFQPLDRIAQVGSHSKFHFTLATEPWCWNSELASGVRCQWSNSQRVLISSLGYLAHSLWDYTVILVVLVASNLLAWPTTNILHIEFEWRSHPATHE